MPSENSTKDWFYRILILIVLLLVVVNMYRGLTVQKIGIPGIFEISFSHPQQPNDPQENTPDRPLPPEIMDFAGRWQTNQPGLEYLIEQNGNHFTWIIPGSESGPGQIEGTDIFPKINGRAVHFFVTEQNPPGRPIQLRTEDPEFRELILFR